MITDLEISLNRIPYSPHIFSELWKSKSQFNTILMSLNTEWLKIKLLAKIDSTILISKKLNSF